MTVRAVLFDLGHTLWDITPVPGALERAYAALRDVLVQRLGRDDLPPPQALQRAVGDALRAAGPTYFTEGRGLDQPPSRTWVDEGLRSLGVVLDAELLRAVTPPLFATEIDGLVCGAGTREAIATLHAAGYRLGCVTNTLADGPAIEAMLRRHGFDDLTSSVVVSADEGRRKPHPSLFLKALAGVDVGPAEAVFVGDSPWHDVAGAHGVGMRAVLTRQYVTRPELDGAEPDAVISHLRELPAVLRRFDAERGGTAPG